MRRLHPLRKLPAILAFCAAFVAVVPARAALPPLAVHRTDDTADCPDAAALAHAVEAQMKRAVLAPSAESGSAADRGLDVQIYKSEEGFTAVIQAGGKTRRLSDKGSSCGGLGAALAVSIAVMLDTDPLPPVPEPPPPPAPPPEPAPAPRAASISPGLPPPVDDRASDVRRFRVSVSVSPVLTDGVLRPFAGGVTADLDFRFGRFSVAGGVLALPGQTIDYPPGNVTLSLTSGVLRGCVAPVTIGGSLGTNEDESIRLALCLDALAGAVHGLGTGYKADRSASLPWAAGGASAVFTQRITGPLSWGVRAWLVIPLLRQSFFVDKLGTAFTPSSVGGALDVGLRVSIW